MNDEQYIRKAVELADGWRLVKQRDGMERMDNNVCAGFPIKVDDLDHIWVSALAAQLVEQVDALDGHSFSSNALQWCYVSRADGARTHFCASSDRTMNTIKAIVNSKVLES